MMIPAFVVPAPATGIAPDADPAAAVPTPVDVDFAALFEMAMPSVQPELRPTVIGTPAPGVLAPELPAAPPQADEDPPSATPEPALPVVIAAPQLPAPVAPVQNPGPVSPPPEAPVPPAGTQPAPPAMSVPHRPAPAPAVTPIPIPVPVAVPTPAPEVPRLKGPEPPMLPPLPPIRAEMPAEIPDTRPVVGKGPEPVPVPVPVPMLRIPPTAILQPAIAHPQRPGSGATAPRKPDPAPPWVTGTSQVTVAPATPDTAISTPPPPYVQAPSAGLTERVIEIVEQRAAAPPRTVVVEVPEAADVVRVGVSLRGTEVHLAVRGGEAMTIEQVRIWSNEVAAALEARGLELGRFDADGRDGRDRPASEEEPVPYAPKRREPRRPSPSGLML